MKQIIVGIISMIFLNSCSTTSSEVVKKSKLQRELSPKATQSELQALVNSNNQFAFSLFEQLDKSDENSFFSPLSVTQALMMSYAGTDTETKQQMRDAMKLTLDDTRIHEVYNKLDLALNDTSDEHVVSIANSIWPSLDFDFEQSYLDTVMVNYGASLKTLDYKNSAKSSTDTINNWVEKKTNNKIKDLIPQGAINDNTKMVLSNATYFKGSWKKEFLEKDTKKESFTQLDGTEKQTEFMHQSDVFSYFEDRDFQAIKLRYKKDKTSMLVLLPKNDTATLSQTKLDDIQKSFQRYRVTLSLPKFKLTTNSMQLIEPLKSLGIELAFDSSRADFSKLSKTPGLFITNMIQKAFIEIDEKGTQAAAATAVLIGVTGFEEVPTATMSVDKAFYYLIVDDATQSILFLGHMVSI